MLTHAKSPTSVHVNRGTYSIFSLSSTAFFTKHIINRYYYFYYYYSCPSHIRMRIIRFIDTQYGSFAKTKMRNKLFALMKIIVSIVAPREIYTLAKISSFTGQHHSRTTATYSERNWNSFNFSNIAVNKWIKNLHVNQIKSDCAKWIHDKEIEKCKICSNLLN